MLMSEEFFNCRRRLWSVKQIPLSLFATKTLQCFPLLLVFYALCNYLQAKSVSQHDDDTDDLEGLRIRGHAGNEATVDFQCADGKTLKTRK